jgi:hypothetical protein
LPFNKAFVLNNYFTLFSPDTGLPVATLLPVVQDEAK